MKEIVIHETLILVDTFKKIHRTKRFQVTNEQYEEYLKYNTEKAYWEWRNSIRKK